MSNEVQFQDNRWLVFIDGVQVPYQQVNVSSQMNGVASITVSLEPDAILSRLRPKALITLFCRDRYSSRQYDSVEQDILHNYLYFASGELEAIGDNKGPHSRGVQLSFVFDLNIFESHQGFISGIGGNPFYGQIVGTSLLNPLDADVSGAQRDLIAFATLVTTFEKEISVGGTKEPVQHRNGADQASEDFGLRMLRLISWFASHNASVRMQCVRTRLLNRVAAVQDNTLDLLADRSVALPLFQSTQSIIGSEDSILDMIRKLQSKVGYRFVTCFLPYCPEDQPAPGSPNLAPMPRHFEQQLKNPELFQLRRDWFRNDYLWLPDLFYAPPPPCNFIFPDMLGARQASRVFSSEPTRSVFVDTGLAKGARLAFVEAPGLVSEDLNELLTPDQFWSNLTYLMQPESGTTAPTDSPWRSQVSAEGGSVSLLDQLSDEEFEKGVVLNWQQLDDEYMLALSRALILKNEDGSYDRDALARLDSLLKTESVSKSGSDDEVKTKAYLVYVQEWLRYKHQLARWNRPSNIVLKGHRWIVPGFSAVIFDADTSYLTYVTSVEHSFDATGSETTTVGIDRTRPLTKLNPTLVRKVEVTTNKTEQAIKKARASVQTVFDQDTVRYQDLYNQLTEDYLAIREARSLVEGAQDLGTLGSQFSQAVEPNIRRYEEGWTLIVRRAEAYADISVGTNKNPAGGLTARTNPDMAGVLLSFLDPNYASPAAFERLDASYLEATKAVDAIRAFNDAQVDQVAADQPAHGETSGLSDAIRNFKFTLATRGAEVERLIAEVENRGDFPVPPSYYNEEFIDLRSLDEHYQKLLGCQPFYTGPFADGLNAEVPQVLVSQPLIRRLKAYQQHVKAVRILARVFPAMRQSLIEPGSSAGGSAVLEDANVTVPASWDDITKAVGENQSTMAWQHQQFLKRKAQTLQEYLTRNGFAPALEPIISDEPTPTVFYRMVPIPNTQDSPVVGSDGLSYWWDDSVLCRIVDENSRTGETRVYDSTQDRVDLAFVGYDVVEGPEVVDTGSGQVIRATVRTRDGDGSTEQIEVPVVGTAYGPRGADPLVRQRREAAAARGAVYLTSGFRQDQMIVYSRRHMGSRAFDGE